ncbi:MAG: hypothetical protein N2319_01345 [Candidatus Kapabacteria bacterium]|nr:hypothetical protein [Candidatus Kapabacteria bacterium]
MNRRKVIEFIFIFLLFLSYYEQSKGQTIISKWSDPLNLNQLNSIEDEFAPSWNQFENRLYFNSTKERYSYFYIANLIDSLNFSQPEKLKADININRNNQAYISFYNSNKAFLSTFRQSPRRSYLNIYQSDRKKGIWTEPYLLDSLQFDSFVSHLTISADGSYVIFSSDKLTTGKDTDLWIAYLQDNGTWGNLTPIRELNTSGNEITPFLHNDDTLYFASDGYDGPGGYDIYFSVRVGGLWQKPMPLSDINTKFNESDFVITPSGLAIFSSDRPGGLGKLDLYATRFQTIILEKPEEISELELGFATQVSSLKIIKENFYKLYPLIPYLFNDDGNNFDIRLISDKLILVDNDVQYLSDNIDTLFILVTNLLSKRLSNLTNSSIYLYPLLFKGDSQSEASEKTQSYKNQLISNLKINENRVVISEPIYYKGELKNNPLPKLFFDTDEPFLFNPIRAGEIKYSLDPPAIDCYLTCRPNEILKKWTLELKINDKYSTKLKEGDSLPVQFSINLRDYADLLSKSDSLVLKFSAIDIKDRPVTKTTLLNISYSESNSKKLIELDGKTYDDYYIFDLTDKIDEINHNSRNSFRNYLQRIIQSIEYSKSVTIKYFNPLAEPLASAVQKELNKRVIQKINISFSKSISGIKISDKYTPFFIQILVEK